MTESIEGFRSKLELVWWAWNQAKIYFSFCNYNFLGAMCCFEIVFKENHKQQEWPLGKQIFSLSSSCANNMAKTDRGEIKCDQSQHHSNHEISLLFMGEFFTMENETLGSHCGENDRNVWRTNLLRLPAILGQMWSNLRCGALCTCLIKDASTEGI